MPLTNADIGKILVDESYLSDEELKAVLAQCDLEKMPILRVLFDRGLLTQDLFESAMAEHYKLPFFDLQATPPTLEMVSKLPEEIARTYKCIVVEFDPSHVTIATSEPGEAGLEDILRRNIGQTEAILPETGKKDEKKKSKGFTFGKAKTAGAGTFAGKIELRYATQTAIEATFVHYRKPLATRFQSIIDAQKKVAPEILEEIFVDAIELRASDIHFEPQENIVIVRFRVDGVLHEAGRIPREYYEGVVNRIKIAANMRIDEHYAAQDGAIRYQSHNVNMDIRVSIVPIVDGEKIVMRLLAAYVRALTLAELGFCEHDQGVLMRAAYKPFGMVLTCGPTGSGKSTTLSALLKMRNQPDVNISTIEDPVEYKMQGVNHIQANVKTNLTFANGLRALVRQDPDIILVGEIRDGETANIAVNAALTGHLLFSTLHSNDAATAVPRMLDMGVEPFLLASTLEVVVGQRLLRRICSQCRTSYAVSASEAQKLFPGAERHFPGRGSVNLYKGKGCDACGGTGYRGRIGIYELLEVTDEIEKLIVARASSADITVKAREQGMKSMFEDGFERVKSGITTLEELLRVAAPPDLILGKEKHGKKK